MKIEFESSGQKIIGIIEEGDKEKPVVILCHGLSSNKDRPHYESFARNLKEQDVASLRFDFYGHGESEGTLEEFDFEVGKQNILDSINFLKEEGYSRYIVSGSSFMGVCAIMASELCKDIIALVLMSPGSGTREYEFIYEIADNLKQPTYIIHGLEDDVVPAETSKKLAKHIENCELELIGGADHQFTRMKDFRQEKVARFIERVIYDQKGQT